MDNKIGTIDNDGNMTDDFNSMTSPSDNYIQETTSYDTSSYDNDFDSKDDNNEEFDVFGNSKPTKEKKNLNIKIILIPVVVLLVIIFAIVMFVNSANKYTVTTKNLTIKVKETEEIEVSGKEKVLEQLTYSSKDEKIAKVDDEGNITGVSIGTTIIYVGKNGKKDHEIIVKVETNKEELVLKETNITVEKDATYQLAIKNVLDDDIFSWSSNNENVATVDQFGLVTGVHAGTTTIVVRESDGRTVSTRVTVTSDEILIENISLTEKTIAIGEQLTLKPTINPANALAIYKWKSSKESVVEVDENGVVTGISAGTATITVESHNGKKATAKVTVDASLAASISISGCNGGLAIGSPITLTANLTPDTAKSKVTWTSSNTNIATVSSGKVTGKGVGKVTITATTANGKTASCNLTVSPTAVTSLKASTTSITLDQEATKKLSVSFTPSSAKDYYTVSWKSADTKIATVDSEGVVKGINPGTTTVTASAGGKSVKVSVTVNATAVTSIEMTGCQSTLAADSTLTLSATALPTTAKNKTITWTSSNTTVATVSGGKVTAKSPGVVTITASTANGVKQTCSISVTTPPITSLTASTQSISLSAGNSQTVTLSTNLSTTNFNKYYKVTWTSTDSKGTIISITPNSTNTLKATIKGLAKGVATVHATVGGQSVTIQVTVS